MSNNLIRVLIVLAVLPLLVCTIALGIWHALAAAFSELAFAWRDPQSTPAAKWHLWR
jgi:hypothetical protein